MDDPRDDLEVYVRQFRPRAPRALRELAQSPFRRLRPWLIAAAVLIAAATYTAWPLRRGERAVTEPVVTTSQDPALQATVGRLSRAAHAGADVLDAALSNASPALLLRVDRPESVLSGLAKE